MNTLSKWKVVETRKKLSSITFLRGTCFCLISVLNYRTAIDQRIQSNVRTNWSLERIMFSCKTKNYAHGLKETENSRCSRGRIKHNNIFRLRTPEWAPLRDPQSRRAHVYDVYRQGRYEYLYWITFVRVKSSPRATRLT